MTSQEILSIVRDVLANHPPCGSAELIEARTGLAIIEISDSIVLDALIEISKRTGDKYLLIDTNPEGGPGIDLYIACNSF